MNLTGFAGFGLCWSGLSHLPDRGFGISKIFGLVLGGYGVWILCSLKIMPFMWATIMFVLLLMGVVSVFILFRQKEKVAVFFGENWKYVLIVELLFLFSMVGYGFVHSYSPDISGTEKLPDFAFLNGCLQSTHFPPHDPWYCGETINYYYYGHYIISVLTKFSGVLPQIAFNLAIVLLFAFCVTGSYALMYNLTGRVYGSLWAPLFLAVIGNLDSFYQIFFENAPNQSFNWWLPSRVIVKNIWENGKLVEVDSTINEFPNWSFLLGDMHAHLLVSMLILLGLHVLYNFLKSKEPGFLVFGRGWYGVIAFVTACVALGAIPLTNTWEVPSFFILLVGTLVLNDLKNERAFNPKTMALKIVALIAIVAVAIILYLPFHTTFSPQSSEIKRLPARNWTIFGHFIAVHGFFVFCLLSYSYFRMKEAIRWKQRAFIGGLAISAFFMLAYFMGNAMIPTLLVLMTALAVMLIVPVNSKENMFAILLAMLAIGQVLGCEFVYIEDNFGGQLERMNTVFKFYFQAWFFFSLACAYMIANIIGHHLKLHEWKTRLGWMACFMALLGMSLIFTFMGPWIKTNGFKQSGHIPTMDGIAYMDTYHPDDYDAIQWLQQRESGDSRILETTGTPFSHYSRISACTGLPTLLGWANHEGQWRRGTDINPYERTNDVKRIYSSDNFSEIKGLLDQYQVKLIYVGGLEKKDYGQDIMDKFESMFPLVHQGRGGKIYQVK